LANLEGNDGRQLYVSRPTSFSWADEESVASLVVDESVGKPLETSGAGTAVLVLRDEPVKSEKIRVVLVAVDHQEKGVERRS